MDILKQYCKPVSKIIEINTEKPLALSLNPGGADPGYGMDAKERDIEFEDAYDKEKRQWKDGIW